MSKTDLEARWESKFHVQIDGTGESRVSVIIINNFSYSIVRIKLSFKVSSSRKLAGKIYVHLVPLVGC